MLEFRCGWVGVVSVFQAEAGWVGVVSVFQAEAGWVGVVSVLQAEAQPATATPKLQHTSKQEHTTNVVIQ